MAPGSQTGSAGVARAAIRVAAALSSGSIAFARRVSPPPIWCTRALLQMKIELRRITCRFVAGVYNRAMSQQTGHGDVCR